LLFNVTRNKRTCQQLKQTSVCTYSDKNEGKRIKTLHVQRQRGTNDFLCTSQSHLGSDLICFSHDAGDWRMKI